MVDPSIGSAEQVYLQGKRCPKCGYARNPQTPGPRWHCPSCYTAYSDFAPRPAASSLAVETWANSSFVVLIGANLLTIAAVVWFGLSLGQVMFVYWTQSVLIGLSFFIRMLVNLWWTKSFTGDKGFYPFFFVAHYGIFHIVYLFFLLMAPQFAQAKPVRVEGVGGSLVLVFAFAHAYSLWYNIRRDRIGKPDVTTMFWLPYARIIPMHATIILGATFAGGAMLLFLALKALADVMMHVAEHYVLRRHGAQMVVWR
jgi:Family of unknown function (DUF6498)